jgi:hypothetical protein
VKLKVLFLALALSVPSASFAIIGTANGGALDRLIIRSEQFKGVSDVLENRLGRSLSAQEKMGLAKVFRPYPVGPIGSEEDDSLIIRVSDGGKDKALSLYCIGYSVGAVWEMTRAICASPQTWKAYDLATIGGGIKFEATASAFRMLVSFDSSRYSETFDPIPGKYVLGSMGGALGLAYTGYAGDSGNKSLTGISAGIGLGLNLGNVSALIIQ